MALDKEFFDSINIELVKKKYYNANKVNAVLEDIRAQAVALSEENQTLRKQLEAYNGQKAELGDAVMSARTVYKEIVDMANSCAATIIKDAQHKHDEMCEENVRMQDYAVKRVGDCMEKLRVQTQQTLELINSEWQSFLCDLEGKGEEAAPEKVTEKTAEKTYPDIGAKLEAIEKELHSINNPEKPETPEVQENKE